MTGEQDNECCGTYASPPCYMHEVDPAYVGLVDPQQRTDVMRWRKAERERLLKQRLAIPSEIRRQRDILISGHLEQAIGDAAGLAVGIYWPLPSDPDLGGLLQRLAARGARIALPVIMGPDEPLIFRTRTIDQGGPCDIPRPADEAEVELSDVVIAAALGFDPWCHRLGTGNGCLDRTLAALPKRPRTFAVGYSEAAMATIYPQPYDIPMDSVVTEDGVISGPSVVDDDGRVNSREPRARP